MGKLKFKEAQTQPNSAQPQTHTDPPLCPFRPTHSLVRENHVRASHDETWVHWVLWKQRRRSQGFRGGRFLELSLEALDRWIR